MALLIYIGTPTPQGWVAHFDNTEWEGDTAFGTWDGSEWDAESGRSGWNIWLNELGTWVEGYRPTKIRVTHDVGGSILLQIRDSNSTTIVNNGSYNSLDEINIPFGSFDMKELIIGQNEFSSYSATNIEFFNE